MTNDLLVTTKMDIKAKIGLTPVIASISIHNFREFCTKIRCLGGERKIAHYPFDLIMDGTDEVSLSFASHKNDRTINVCALYSVSMISLTIALSELLKSNKSINRILISVPSCERNRIFLSCSTFSVRG